MPKKKVSNIKPLFGRRLKQYRVACGITQDQVASVLNINRTTYTKYETSVSEPSYEMLGRMVSLFGIDFNSLLGEKDISEVIYDSKLPMFNLTKDEQNVIIAIRSFSADEKSVLNDKMAEILENRRKELVTG